MKNLNKKAIIGVVAGLLVVVLGYGAWQQIGSLSTVQEKITAEQFEQRVKLAQSLYSRNLQALELSDLALSTSSEQNFNSAARLWKENLKSTNLKLKTWLSENRVLNLQLTTFSKDLNIGEGQLRQATESQDEQLVAQAIYVLVIKSIDIVEKADGIGSELISIAEAIVRDDKPMLDAAQPIAEGN